MRIISIIMFCLAVAGCGEETEPVVVNGQKQYKKGEVYSTEKFEYVDFDGHEYVRWVSIYRGEGGLAHSPKCKCQKKGLCQ